MYSLQTKVLIALWVVVMGSGAWFTLAQSTNTTTWSSLIVSSTGSVTSLKTFSQDRQHFLKQRVTNLQESFLWWSGVGADYRDMVSVLQCLQIPFVDTNQLSRTVLQELSDDMIRDWQAIDHDIDLLPTATSSGDIRVSVLRQLIDSTSQKYMTTLDTLTLSLQNEQLQSIKWIDRLISSNKSLFQQLLSDKRLVDAMIQSSTQREQKMSSQRTSLGFTQKQMDAIIANYRDKMTSYVNSWLQSRADRLLKQYKDIIPFAAFVQTEKEELLIAYRQQINDRFAQRLGDTSTSSSYASRLHETVKIMQQQFYQWSGLQCGLLTSMTQTQRSNYRSIVADLNSSIAILGSATTVNTGTISLSSWFIADLNTRYHSSSKALLDWFVLSVRDQVSLWKKAILVEKMPISELQIRFLDYRKLSSSDSATLSTKKAIKAEILATIDKVQKQWILSLRSQKSLDRMSKELRAQK